MKTNLYVSYTLFVSCVMELELANRKILFKHEFSFHVKFAFSCWYQIFIPTKQICK